MFLYTCVSMALIRDYRPCPEPCISSPVSTALLSSGCSTPGPGPGPGGWLRVGWGQERAAYSSSPGPPSPACPVRSWLEGGGVKGRGFQSGCPSGLPVPRALWRSGRSWLGRPSDCSCLWGGDRVWGAPRNGDLTPHLRHPCSASCSHACWATCLAPTGEKSYCLCRGHCHRGTERGPRNAITWAGPRSSMSS